MVRCKALNERTHPSRQVEEEGVEVDRSPMAVKLLQREKRQGRTFIETRDPPRAPAWPVDPSFHRAFSPGYAGTLAIEIKGTARGADPAIFRVRKELLPRRLLVGVTKDSIRDVDALLLAMIQRAKPRRGGAWYGSESSCCARTLRCASLRASGMVAERGGMTQNGMIHGYWNGMFGSLNAPPPPAPGLVRLYSCPNCPSTRFCSVTVSGAVYSRMRGIVSSAQWEWCSLCSAHGSAYR